MLTIRPKRRAYAGQHSVDQQHAGDQVRLERRKVGHTFSQPDLIIAATALQHGLTVVTRDTGDYKPARVSLLNPWTRRMTSLPFAPKVPATAIAAAGQKGRGARTASRAAADSVPSSTMRTNRARSSSCRRTGRSCRGVAVPAIPIRTRRGFRRRPRCLESPQALKA